MEFGNLTMSRNIEYNRLNNGIKFYYSGIYKITVTYRGGSGTDKWTAFRLKGFASADIIGVSSGAGLDGTADPSAHAFVFYAQVTDISDTYFVQIGRHDGTSLTIKQTGTIEGTQLPVILVTIQYLGF